VKIAQAEYLDNFFENAHEWKPHHWNQQEPRTLCKLFTVKGGKFKFSVKGKIWHLLLAMGPKLKYLLRLNHLYSNEIMFESRNCVFIFSVHFWPLRQSPKDSNSAFNVSTNISRYRPLLRHLLPSSEAEFCMIWGLLSKSMPADRLPHEGVKLTERRSRVSAASETASAIIAKTSRYAKENFIFVILCYCC